jgi:Tol biopolymer transport system component/predicted Ser/Thr protein kinase
MTFDFRNWPGADDVLDAALALPIEQRADYVRRTVSDPALVRALDAVLAEAVENDPFLEPAGAWSGRLASELQREVEDMPPALAPGFQVEHYEVVGAIGRGGMGEVYRARDTRLGRDVALKVLPVRYARDAERQARFKREARVLAALNHPGIAGIYGVAEAENVEALVLELVEGPTLAEVIRRGALPLHEVLIIARQIVDALALAHARGILHRDLKPANIKVAPPATVKILDFGLARVLASVDRPEAAPDVTTSSANVLLGTAAYMSPEQARGGAVDERSDIWAFGCVLFEVLTGTRAFAGHSVADVLAAVIEREPAFSLLPAATPEPLRRLLRRCLDKNPDRRLGFIGDARLELDDAAAPALEAVDTPPRAGYLAVAVVIGLALLAAGAAVAWYAAQPAAVAPQVSRLMMPLPSGDAPVTGFQPMPALAPDGRTVVYRARRAGTTQLFRRDLHALDATPIAGTEGATSPFFSPDGQWLAFDSDGVLKRVAIAGGTPVVICSAPGGVTGAWLDDDSIVIATNTTRVLQRVPASGGTPEPLTALDPSRGDTLHLLPQALPGGRRILFTVVTGATRHIAVLEMPTGAVRIVGEGSHARYLAGNVLVFAREGALWAATFDPDRLTVGTAVPLDERPAHTDNTVFHYAIAASGALVYLPPQSEGSRQRLAWIDRAGRETPVDVEPRPFVRLALSPDNERLALALDEGGNQDIWIVDPSRQTMSRLTFEPTIETMPAWSPDGEYVAFRSEREGPGVFRRAASGTGVVERLTTTDGPIHSPYSWTPDGRSLLLAVFRSFRNQAIARVTPPDTTIEILLDGDFAQLDPHVSPDGRWLAYQSDETGRFEIYVRPYPDVDAGRWLVSTAGGTSPRWSPTGRELFYFDGESMMRVALTASPSFVSGRPEPLFAVTPFGGRLGPGYAVASDGQRFLFLLPGPTTPETSTGLIVVQHWVEELRQRLAQGR